MLRFIKLLTSLNSDQTNHIYTKSGQTTDVVNKAKNGHSYEDAYSAKSDKANDVAKMLMVYCYRTSVMFFRSSKSICME